jgi:fucose permease
VIAFDHIKQLRPSPQDRPETVSSIPARPSRTRKAPAAALLHLTLLLAGLATALLGPILPILSLSWHLSDQQSGLLLLAQFCGATAGGLTVSKHLQRSLKRGLAAAAIGFAAFAAAPSPPVACIALFAAGWGCGQLIASVNILAGRRYAAHRGSALALLNFSFSLGAMLSPLLAGWLTPHVALRTLLAAFAACFAVVFIAMLFDLTGHTPEEMPATDMGPDESRLTLRVCLYFALLLFLYGGVETSLDGWLTTLALRYGSHALAVSQYTTLVLWASLTAGRAISSALLLRTTETRLQRAALVVTSLCIAGLAFVHGSLPIVVLAAILGISLAPFFPATFSLLMADRPSARQAGVVLAMSGLGAAFLPALMGVVSTHAGSLQIALAIPLAAGLALLALSFNRPGV